jgi:hypothetical protein
MIAHTAKTVKLCSVGEYPLHRRVIALPFACAGSFKFFDLTFFDLSFCISAPGGVNSKFDPCIPARSGNNYVSLMFHGFVDYANSEF